MKSSTYFSEVGMFFQTLNSSFKTSTDDVSNSKLVIYTPNKTFVFIALNSDTHPHSNNSIGDIIIHEDVWRNRNLQVKSRLNSLLGLNSKVHARQCFTMQINKEMSEDFLNTNHLHGYKKSATRLGLFKEKELMAVATFSSGRKMNRLPENERSYELISFASKNNITVVGGFDKLIKKFTKLKSPADIMTYVDKEWGNTTAFEKLGFKAVGYSKPLTFYVDKHYKRHKENDETESRIKLQNKGNVKLVKTILK